MHLSDDAPLISPSGVVQASDIGPFMLRHVNELMCVFQKIGVG